MEHTTAKGKAGVDHVGVTTVFFCHDGNGNVLFAKRSSKTRDERGAWEPGSGQLELGLTAEENAIKEISEEYGAAPSQLDFIGYFDALRTNHEGQSTHWIAICFAALVNRDEVKNNEPESIEEIAWFTLDSLPSPLHSQIQPFIDLWGSKLAELLGN